MTRKGISMMMAAWVRQEVRKNVQPVKSISDVIYHIGGKKECQCDGGQHILVKQYPQMLLLHILLFYNDFIQPQ